MVDITKENFWENKYEQVFKGSKKNSKLRLFIKKYKLIVMLVACFLLLTISNGLLIYNFFKLLSKL